MGSPWKQEVTPDLLEAGRQEVPDILPSMHLSVTARQSGKISRRDWLKDFFNDPPLLHPSGPQRKVLGVFRPQSRWRSTGFSSITSRDHVWI